jgi:hypothetical protein
MERLKTDDGYVSCFIRAFSENGSLEEPLKMVDTIFRFRKEIQLNGNLGSFISNCFTNGIKLFFSISFSKISDLIVVTLLCRSHCRFLSERGYRGQLSVLERT